MIYVSATGATKVSNLSYANRLGLWQTGDFPFTSREDFVESISGGGIAAMEVVARDLKALGLYLARSLSFEGVEYDTLGQTGGNGIFEAKNNLESNYAEHALYELFKQIFQGRFAEVPLGMFEQMTGLSLTSRAV